MYYYSYSYSYTLLNYLLPSTTTTTTTTTYYHYLPPIAQVKMVTQGHRMLFIIESDHYFSLLMIDIDDDL